MMNTALLIYGLCLTMVCIGIVFCMIFLFLILFHIRPLKSNIPLILTCNTYMTSLTSSIIMLRIMIETVMGVLNYPIFYEGWICQLNGYLIYVAIGNVFYSYVLQAIFRLFRVVFYRQKFLYTTRVFTILILLQWFITILVNLPFLLLHDIEFISSEYRCQLSLTNIRACLMLLFIDYLIPGNVMLTIYLYIIRYIRQRNHRIMHRHDIVVLKKTLIMFTMVQLLSIPLVVLWLMYVIDGYLTPLSYQLQAITVAFSQSLTPIMVAYSTTQIRELFKCQQRHRVRPFPQNRIGPNVIPLRTR